MAKFNFEFTNRFQKQFKKLPENIKKSTLEKVKILQTDPFHNSLRTKKHKHSGYFESSITMNYRILWIFKEDTIILLIRIGDHSILDKV